MKKKVLLTSLLSIVTCISLVAGATMALFTSESKVNIAVSSGTVEVVASVDVDSVQYKSLNVTTWTDAEDGYTAFDQIGGNATVTDSKVTLTNVVAGDALKFNVVIENNSTVAVNTRTIIKSDPAKDTGLFALLNVKIDNAAFNGAIVSNWQLISPNSDDVIVPVEIEIPVEVDTDAALACEITVTVEAVQGNAEVMDSFNENEDGTYTITDKYGLISFAKSVNNGNTYEGKTVYLASDIDLANETWTPIGYVGEGETDTTYFNGTFNGQNHTISNLYINDPEMDQLALFGCINNATIEGITVENVDITGKEVVAAIAAYAFDCEISDCHVTGSVRLVANSTHVGGIVAYCEGDVSNCSVSATTEKGVITAIDKNAVGGISAWSYGGDHKITGCAVENIDLTGWANIGAITGFCYAGDTIQNCTVKNVTLTKTREDGHASIGLAAGGWSYAQKETVISNNEFENVTLNGSFVANAGATILFGSEYGTNTDISIFKTENNEMIHITNNLIAIVKENNAADLKAALENSAKVTLQADVSSFPEDFVASTAYTAYITIESGATVTLDLNGHTLTTATATSGISVKGNLTVQNGTIAKKPLSTEEPYPSNTPAPIVIADGTLNLEGVTITVGDGNYEAGITLNKGTLNLNEGTVITVTGGKTTTSYGVWIVGGSDNIGGDDNIINFNGGKLIVDADGENAEYEAVAFSTFGGDTTINANSGEIIVNAGEDSYAVYGYGATVTINLKSGFTYSVGEGKEAYGCTVTKNTVSE